MRRWAVACAVGAAALLAPAAAQMGNQPPPPGGASMYPIDFDGDGDVDIVKSSPIGIIWLENHGTDKEWETHIISLNQNIKDAVAAHKKDRKFINLMEGKVAECGEDDEAAEDAEAEDAVVIKGEASLSIGGDDGDDGRGPTPGVYAEQRAEL